MLTRLQLFVCVYVLVCLRFVEVGVCVDFVRVFTAGMVSPVICLPDISGVRSERERCFYCTDKVFTN